MKLHFKLNENSRMAKQYVKQGKLSKEDFNTLREIDPSDSNKYVGWMAKQLINFNISFDDLRNTIEEFHVFAEAGKTKIKDIYQVKTFDELQKEVDHLNSIGADISVKDLENDYEIIIDNDNLIVASPHTHEASRKLGLTTFAYRDNCKDSAWCTTYKAPNHFNDYYYKHNVTFYYVKAKSPEIGKKLKQEFGKDWKRMTVIAIAVLDDGKKDIYDGLDGRVPDNKIQQLLNIYNLS